MRAGLATVAALLAVTALGQNPNVTVKLDAAIQYRWTRGGDTDIRAYDPLGKHSVVALQFTLEPGFDFTFSERFQKIPGDADSEQLDEYYIEDRGLWRFGKQYVPFGRGIVVRESVYSARLDSRLGELQIPVTASYLEGGTGRPTGAVARAGGKVGLSVGYGRRLAQSATALTVIRRPEESPGRDRGYKLLIGVDYVTQLTKQLSGSIEHVSLSRGETEEDLRLEISDLVVRWNPEGKIRGEIGLTHEWQSDDTFVRLVCDLFVYEGFRLEPFVRFRNGRFFDAALTLRIRP